jgi:DmsE family decaheme c-type cytochrome
MTSSVGCASCHSEHKPRVKLKQLTASEPELCYRCHLETRPELSKPFHDPVNEGLVQCSDCHNPHGGYLPKQLRTTAAQDEMCFKCHAEKSGPFVFEHAPVKTEGCVACHMPIHGSSNPRLLSRANINLQCLECHTATVGSTAQAPPSFHNQAQKYQACTLCHTQIHGSNFDKNFLR